MSELEPHEPPEVIAWPAGKQLCDRCRMHYPPDDMELVEIEVEEPELWCIHCRQEPSGWAR